MAQKIRLNTRRHLKDAQRKKGEKPVDPDKARKGWRRGK
jgi:hypothetical protein